MASQIPPKKNAAFTFYAFLTSQADPKLFQANPTLATGDAKVSIDGGAFANLTTLPDVDPNSGVAVKVALSADEMNGDNIQVTLIDAAGAQWCDVAFNIQTADRQVNDLAFPVVSGRGIDVTTGGGVGIDWSNVENPTTALNLSGTNIDPDQVVASVTGAVGSVTGAVGSVTGAVGSVTGAVGSVTGNVGGNVTGTVGSVVGNVGGSTASVVGAVGSVTGNVGGNVTGSVGSVVGAVGSVTGNVGGNVTGSVGSVVGAVGSVAGAVGSVTGDVGGDVVGSVGAVVADVDANIVSINGTDVIGDGDGTPWGPA